MNLKLVIGETFDEHLWLDPMINSILLYPSVESSQTDVSKLAIQEKKQLVILDGTWRQTNAMLRLNPSLAELPRISLSPSEKSRYRLRQASVDHSLSTLEACTQALAVLDQTNTYDGLYTLFDQMIEQQINAMGYETYERLYLSKQGSREQKKLMR